LSTTKLEPEVEKKLTEVIKRETGKYVKVVSVTKREEQWALNFYFQNVFCTVVSKVKDEKNVILSTISHLNSDSFNHFMKNRKDPNKDYLLQKKINQKKTKGK